MSTTNIITDAEVALKRYSGIDYILVTHVENGELQAAPLICDVGTEATDDDRLKYFIAHKIRAKYIYVGHDHEGGVYTIIEDDIKKTIVFIK